jgi:hypothetical protein
MENLASSIETFGFTSLRRIVDWPFVQVMNERASVCFMTVGWALHGPPGAA